MIGFGSPNKAEGGVARLWRFRRRGGADKPAAGIASSGVESQKEIYRAWDGREKGESAAAVARKSLLLMRKHTEAGREFTAGLSGGLPGGGNPPRKIY
ncbi:hypothetical protein KCP78_12070 [Salmonella enterica subsp. enterica]|nr:hypothetical protein KCP78_12070 [Salmonella enterica subsp. enterica]